MRSTAPVIRERRRNPGGRSSVVVEPDRLIDGEVRLASLAKAVADPTRLRVVDALRKASPEAVCQCELLPLFDISQPALAKHLKILVAAGVVGRERRGLWTHYFLLPQALGDLHAWLG